MFRLVLVSALVALVAGAPQVSPSVPTLDGSIVGGEEVGDIAALPYQLSLQQFTRHICGATLLSTTRALTAAHCTDGVRPSSVRVRAGVINHITGGQSVGLDSISQHPKYDPITLDYDLSILTFDWPLELDATVQPINLHSIGSELDVGTVATVSGWRTASPPSVILQKAEVAKVSDSSCQSRYESITDRMTCHGSEAGGSCLGDSGSPLVVNQTLVGVASWGQGCASAGNPIVYAKVSNAENQDYINSSA